jgi:hypothetical protein
MQSLHNSTKLYAQLYKTLHNFTTLDATLTTFYTQKKLSKTVDNFTTTHNFYKTLQKNKLIKKYIQSKQNFVNLYTTQTLHTFTQIYTKKTLHKTYKLLNKQLHNYTHIYATLHNPIQLCLKRFAQLYTTVRNFTLLYNILHTLHKPTNI